MRGSALSRAAAGNRRAGRRAGGVLPRRRADLRRRLRGRLPGVLVLLALAARSSLGFGALGSFLGCARAPARRSRRSSRCCSSSSSCPRWRAARPDRSRLVPDRSRRSTRSLTSRGVRSLSRGLGLVGARARVRHRRAISVVRSRSPRGARPRWSGRERARIRRSRWASPGAAEQRRHQPGAPAAPLLFPLFFFTAFAGGLSSQRCCRASTSKRLHGVPVRLRPAPVGRLRRCLHRLRDRP